MQKTISQIYSEHKIWRGLQDHMFKVAAVASLICDNFSDPLDRNEIISACLLHDMGNIVRTNFEYLHELFEPEGIEYWKGIQKEYIEKYGEDDRTAAVEILSEIGFPASFITLATNNTPALVCAHSLGNDIPAKILFYADARVSPHGVLSYEERQAESTARYHSIKGGIIPRARVEMVECGRVIEKQIFEKCAIKPEDITEEAIQPLLLELRDFMVK